MNLAMPDEAQGCVSFFCRREGMGEERKKPGERGERQRGVIKDE
jgi:hypothetical protein